MSQHSISYLKLLVIITIKQLTYARPISELVLCQRHSSLSKTRFEIRSIIMHDCLFNLMLYVEIMQVEFRSCSKICFIVTVRTHSIKPVFELGFCIEFPAFLIYLERNAANCDRKQTILILYCCNPFISDEAENTKAKESNVHIQFGTTVPEICIGD